VSTGKNWYGVSLSSSGQYQCAVVYNDYLYTSTDYGVSWKQQFTTQNWRSASISSNGQYITAAGNGIMYTSITPYSNLAIGNSSAFGGDISANSRLYVGSDVSFGGNLFINKSLNPTTISEPFVTNTGTTSPYTLSYATAGTFYITTPPASNFTINLTNVPVDINRTYVVTLVITATTNKTYCNSVQINGAIAITPYYAGGVPSSITSGSIITQVISIQRISVGDVAANNIVLTSITAWY
jgi:hypothetical protein